MDGLTHIKQLLNLLCIVYYRFQQLELRHVLQMEYIKYIEYTSKLNILKQLFNALKSNIQSAQMQSRMSTRGSFWFFGVVFASE